jgi:hypothetical protein
LCACFADDANFGGADSVVNSDGIFDEAHSGVVGIGAKGMRSFTCREDRGELGDEKQKAA